MAYEFTEAMGEISGFGGGYEEACRIMLKAGMEWLDANPEAKPEFVGYKNVYGIITEENDDARALSAAVIAPVDGASGAMHQAVIQHCLVIREKGWDHYVSEMSKRDESKT